MNFAGRITLGEYAIGVLCKIRCHLLKGWNSLYKHEFAGQVSLLAGGTAGAYGINLAIAPLLTRIYSTAAFGHLQVYVSLLGIALVLSALRYDLSVLLPEDDDVAANLVAVAFTSILLVTSLLTATVFVALRYHLLWRRVAELGGYLWLLPVGAFGLGIYQLLNAWGLRHGAYKDVAFSKFSQMGAQAAVQLASGIVTHGSMGGLLIGDTCGRLAGSLRIAKITFGRDWHCLRRVRPGTMWRAAKRYRNFPLVLTGSGLINSAGLQAVPLLLSVFYSPEVLGLYAVTERTLQIPGVLIGQAVAQVYMVKAARLGVADPQELYKLHNKLVTRSLLIGMLPLLVFCAVAPILFRVVFGSSWQVAGTYARMLAPMYYLAFIHSCTGMTLNMLERQHWQLAWDILRLIAVGLTMVLGALAGLDSTHLLGIFAVVGASAYVVHIALCYRAISHCEQRNLKVSKKAQAVAIGIN